MRVIRAVVLFVSLFVVPPNADPKQPSTQEQQDRR